MEGVDSVRTIAHSMGRFLSGTLLSRIAGFGRDVTLAALFGSTPAMAAFLMAFRFVNLPRRLFGEGAMHAAFVPAYEGLKSQDPARARHLFDDLTSALTLFLALLLTLVAIPLWMSGSEVALFTLRMLPAALFLCLYGVNTAYLNCERTYFLPSLAPVAFNLVLIASAWAVRDLTLLASLVVIAFGAQWLVTFQRTRFSLRPFTPDVRTLITPLLLGIAGVAATQINSALDPIFARLASPEGPAYLWYAIRLQQMPLSLFGVALSGALLPALSRSVGTLQFAHFSRMAMRQTTLIMLPATLFLLLFSDPLVRLIYLRGAFTFLAATETARCLTGYALGLLPMALILVQTAQLHAQKRYRLAALITAASVAINIAANTLLYPVGPQGVAYGTALAAWCQCLLLRMFA